MEEVPEVKSFPKIRFEVCQVTTVKINANLHRAPIAGNLMLRGVNRNHNLNAAFVVGEDSVQRYGDCNIKQTHFGIQIGSIAGGTLRMRDEAEVAFFIIPRKKERAEELAFSRSG